MNDSTDSSASSSSPMKYNTDIGYPPKGSLMHYQCRSIRFGTLRTSPAQEHSLHLGDSGFFFYVKECHEDPTAMPNRNKFPANNGFGAYENVTNVSLTRRSLHHRHRGTEGGFGSLNIHISWKHILEVKYCFCQRLSVIFVLVTPEASKLMRSCNVLRMADEASNLDVPFFDSASKYEFHRYITVILNDGRLAQKGELEFFFRDLAVNPDIAKIDVEEMNYQAANLFLVKTLDPRMRPASVLGSSGVLGKRSANTSVTADKPHLIGSATALTMLHSENTDTATPSTVLPAEQGYFRPLVAAGLNNNVSVRVVSGIVHVSTQSQPQSMAPHLGLVRNPVVPIPRLPVRDLSTMTTRNTHQKVIKTEPEVLFSYVPAAGGEITVHDVDLACLEEGEFLNDTIIDFYLDYLVHSLPEIERRRVHVFSTYFWTKFSSSASKSQSGGDQMKKQEFMHSKVARWTKNVDLFEKDFIMIPINEDAHWYLAIVCYPGLDGPTHPEEDNNESDLFRNAERSSESNPNYNLDQTTLLVSSSSNKPVLVLPVIPIASTMAIIDQEPSLTVSNIDVVSRSVDTPSLLDSRNGDVSSSTYEQIIDRSVGIPPPTKRARSDQQESLRGTIAKQPCIILLDSLRDSAPNYKTTKMIRDYLAAEWATRKSATAGVRDFSPKFVKSVYPVPPQQNNWSDCGVFLLEYAERYLFNGLLSSQSTSTESKSIGEEFWAHMWVSGKDLHDWFTVERVAVKRQELVNLLLKLAEEWKSKQLTMVKSESGQSKSDDIIMVSHKVW